MENKGGLAVVSRVHSLAQFLETQVSEGTEWAEFIKLQDAAEPETTISWVEDDSAHYGKFATITQR